MKCRKAAATINIQLKIKQKKFLQLVVRCSVRRHVRCRAKNPDRMSPVPIEIARTTFSDLTDPRRPNNYFRVTKQGLDSEDDILRKT